MRKCVETIFLSIVGNVIFSAATVIFAYLSKIWKTETISIWTVVTMLMTGISLIINIYVLKLRKKKASSTTDLPEGDEEGNEIIGVSTVAQEQKEERKTINVCADSCTCKIVPAISNKAEKLTQKKGNRIYKFKANYEQAELNFIDRNTIDYKHIVHSVLLEEEKERTYKANWSGSEYYSSEILQDYVKKTKRKDKLIESKKTQSPHHVTIQYPRKGRIGSPVNIGYITKLGDSKKEMLPHLSKNVLYDIDELVLRIVVPTSDFVRNVKPNISQDRYRTLPIEKDDIQLERKCIGSTFYYEWTINNPEISLHYAITWDFN